mmetsp:Transcript_15277/g.41854  ORF Transcript_15277/g.41854 Transcript_15277/m.41854 type:complete len:273 (+) Transcript_15277:12-830(+)
MAQAILSRTIFRLRLSCVHLMAAAASARQHGRRGGPAVAAMLGLLAGYALLLSHFTSLAHDRAFMGSLPSFRSQRLGRAALAQAASADSVDADDSASSFVATPLRLASSAMGLLKPFFMFEAKLQAMDYNQAATRKALEAEAKSAPVVVYTYSLSPFSTEATRLLDSIGATYKEVVLAPEWFLMSGSGAAKRAEFAEVFGRSSMPHIFIGGRSIGGLTEGTPGLLPLYESGQLEPALKAVGALPEDNPFGFFTFSGDAMKLRCIGEEFCDVV